VITFDIPLVEVLTLLAGPVMTLVVGLVTTKVTSAARKALLLLALSEAGGLLGQVIDALRNDTSYNLGVGLLLGFGAFLTGVVAHYGLLKHLGVSAAMQDMGRTASAVK